MVLSPSGRGPSGGGSFGPPVADPLCAEMHSQGVQHAACAWRNAHTHREMSWSSDSACQDVSL